MMRRTLKDLRNTDLHRSVPNDLYFLYMHRAFEHHMTSSIVRVAFPTAQLLPSGQVKSGESSFIMGYIICKPSSIGLIIHYLNVRRSVDAESNRVHDNYRKQGIGKALVQSVLRDYKVDPKLPIIYTVRTAMFRFDTQFRLKFDKDKRFTYNPFLFYTLLPQGWEAGIKRNRSQEVYAKSAWEHGLPV